MKRTLCALALISILAASDVASAAETQVDFAEYDKGKSLARASLWVGGTGLVVQLVGVGMVVAGVTNLIIEGADPTDEVNAVTAGLVVSWAGSAIMYAAPPLLAAGTVKMARAARTNDQLGLATWLTWAGAVVAWPAEYALLRTTRASGVLYIGSWILGGLQWSDASTARKTVEYASLRVTPYAAHNSRGIALSGRF